MLRYQADNGWQTKITPDSRALIKLGLGPDHKGLLNPETANIPSPHELGVDSPDPARRSGRFAVILNKVETEGAGIPRPLYVWLSQSVTFCPTILCYNLLSFARGHI